MLSSEQSSTGSQTNMFFYEPLIHIPSAKKISDMSMECKYIKILV